MSTLPVQILLVLPCPGEEFAEPLAELRQQAEVFECQTPRAAAEYLCTVPCPPTLVILAQSRPGEFAYAELDLLAQLAPLARFVILLGSWCEGETRTGKIWPVATRVFWYEWQGEVRRNLPLLAIGRNASWLSPVTTLQEERYLLPAVSRSAASARISTSPVQTGTRAAPLVLVATARSSFGEALCSACRQQGFMALWQRPDRPVNGQPVAAIIWEGVQMLPTEIAELQLLAAQWPHAPILALIDFPRQETRQRALAAGAQAVLAKPCSLDDLIEQLQRWCPSQDAKSADYAA